MRGRVLPATTEPVVLKAESDGGPVAGQVAVSGTDHIRRVSLVPVDAVPPVAVVEALDDADLIVIGPGSLFTSVLAAIVVPGIRQAIARSTARKVYVCNLHPQDPETGGFDVGMHLSALVAHGVVPDVALCDTSNLSLGDPCVPVVETPLGRPNGMAHDSSRLAGALSALVG